MALHFELLVHCDDDVGDDGDGDDGEVMMMINYSPGI